MVSRIRLVVALMLALCLAFVVIHPGTAQQNRALAALILNGDFEGDFYTYGSGKVAQYWVPYDLSAVIGAPQFLRSTLRKHDGQASQLIWADRANYHAGIMQTTLLTSALGGVRIQAGKIYTARVWMYSIYAGIDSAVQNNKLNKRVGIDPGGGINPQSTQIVWTPWDGQDKVWVQINCAATALGDRLTVFIEADDPTTGGQDQVYIDSVTLEGEGAPTPTRTRTMTPTPTAMPTHTPTPVVAVLRRIEVGRQPQGMGVMPRIKRFFVANNLEGTVSSLEGFFDWRHTRLPSGGESPSNLAADPDQCRAYVANTTTNSVGVLNVCAGRQIGSISLGDGRAPDGIAVLTTTNTIYVANSAASSVSVIDGNTLTVTKAIPVGPRPGQIAVNPHTNKVYVTTRGAPESSSGTVTVIDAITQRVTKTIGLSTADPQPAPEPYGVALNLVTNRVFVASASGKLVIINGDTDQVVRVLSAPEAGALDAVAVNPVSNNVFVSSLTGDRVFVYDVDLDGWGYTLTVGAGSDLPRGIAVNPLTYQVLISNPGDDTLCLIRDYGTFQPFHVWLPGVVKPLD